jgi:hypothetical protein
MTTSLADLRAVPRLPAADDVGASSRSTVCIIQYGRSMSDLRDERLVNVVAWLVFVVDLAFHMRYVRRYLFAFGMLLFCSWLSPTGTTESTAPEPTGGERSDGDQESAGAILTELTALRAQLTIIEGQLASTGTRPASE